MKELSIEEKAKAYDEAIEKLRTFYRDYDTVSCLIDVKEELANRFPELKESEDERMKKIISDILLIDSDEIREILDANNVLMQNIDAWLEKQGEQKQSQICHNDDPIIDSELNNYCCKFFNALHKENGGKLSFARLQHLAMDIYKWCKEQIQSEQNPAWNEEDERIKQDIENLIHFALRDGSAVSPAADTTKEDAISWMQSLKERVQPQPKQ